MQKMEENKRMEKARDLFKKLRDTKGIFHAKMGSIKARNAMDLTEVKNIKKKWQMLIKNNWNYQVWVTEKEKNEEKWTKPKSCEDPSCELAYLLRESQKERNKEIAY